MFHLLFCIMCRVVKILLEAGADPNLGDDYTSPGLMAKEKHLHSLQGKHLLAFVLIDIEH